MLRFDGVGSCLRVWVNGDYVGGGKGRLPWEFDVGELLRPGQENVLAVRVHQWSSGSYLEGAWQAGLLGDVELLCRPAGAIDDLFVHADYDRVTGAGRLRVDADVPVRVTVPELGVDVAGGEEVVARARRAVERRDPAALRRRGRERGRARGGADRLPARDRRGRPAAGQRPPGAGERRWGPATTSSA